MKAAIKLKLITAVMQLFLFLSWLCPLKIATNFVVVKRIGHRATRRNGDTQRNVVGERLLFSWVIGGGFGVDRKQKAGGGSICG